MIIGITGLCIDKEGNTRSAGAGKDEVANRLCRRADTVNIALADPLKRICMDVFDFTEEQLWGPSELRNKPDRRYPNGAAEYRAAALREEQSIVLAEEAGDQPRAEYHRQSAEGYAREGWLTPRYALQQLGTEWGRRCYPNAWVELCLRIAAKLVMPANFPEIPKYVSYAYYRVLGLTPTTEPAFLRDVTISDVRFFNEHKAIKAAGGVVIRVTRHVDTVFKDMNGNHQSERELTMWTDDKFDYVLENNSDLHTLHLMTDRMSDVLHGRLMDYDEAQADVPPFLRSKTP